MKSTYSRFISAQAGPAEKLAKIIDRHRHSAFLRPIPVHQLAVFSLLRDFVSEEQRPIIIDSCCGTGLSTIQLAELFPGHFIVGIDKSETRLSRAKRSISTNYLLLRGEVIDQWRLLYQEKLPISHHFLFFPNPWPKAAHVKRRFHAHPVFFTMAKLAPYFEMRSNWDIYAEECLIALKTLGHEATLELKNDAQYFTLFEKKYLQAGCSIYIVKATQPASLI